jgi:hypothetical protein
LPVSILGRYGILETDLTVDIGLARYYNGLSGLVARGNRSGYISRLGG